MIVTSGMVIIGITQLRDLLPEDRGGNGEGFQPRHLLGGMAATTMLLLFGEVAPELAKAFAVMTAVIAFVYSGAGIAESFFVGQEEKPRRKPRKPPTRRNR